MEYLERAKNAFGQPLYDPQTALQLSRQHNLISASIELLWQLQLFEASPPTPPCAPVTHPFYPFLSSASPPYTLLECGYGRMT